MTDNNKHQIELAKKMNHLSSLTNFYYKNLDVNKQILKFAIVKD